VPFCSAICPYCDFAVTTGDEAARSSYVDRVLAEAALWQVEVAERFGKFDTLYFGGGTPSALSASDFERLVTGLRQRLPITDDVWISTEVNPEDVTDESLEHWRRLGVGTISLGVQSFDDDELKYLGRRHDRAEAIASVERATSAGFPIVSVDLMFGLPDQSPAAWEASLETTVALAPQHVSCYQLTVHEGTPFARKRKGGRLVELEEEQQADFYARTHSILADGGLAAYEVSNFAAGLASRSRHNQKYWRGVPYLGLGVSSHSFDGTRRFWSERSVADYASRVETGERPIAEEESLTKEERALEILMLGLRTVDGIDLAAFREDFGVDLVEKNREFLEDVRARGIVAGDDERLRLTPSGLAITDAIVRDLQL